MAIAATAPKIKASEEKCLVYQFGEKHTGGIIVFSTDLNAVKLDSNEIINWTKEKCKSLQNSVGKRKMFGKNSQKSNIEGISVGNYLKRRYKAKDGHTFSEDSLSVEIIGVDENTLIEMAEDICRDFKQESVLVKKYSDGYIYFVDPVQDENVSVPLNNSEPLFEMAKINKNDSDNSLFSANSYRIMIYSNDLYPAHIHVIKDDWDIAFLIEDGSNYKTKSIGKNKQIENLHKKEYQ